MYIRVGRWFGGCGSGIGLKGSLLVGTQRKERFRLERSFEGSGFEGSTLSHAKGSCDQSIGSIKLGLRFPPFRILVMLHTVFLSPTEVAIQIHLHSSLLNSAGLFADVPFFPDRRRAENFESQRYCQHRDPA